MLQSRRMHRTWKFCQRIQHEWLAFTKWEVGEILNSIGNFFFSLFYYYNSILLDGLIEVLQFFRWQRAEDSKSESQIVNVLQDIVEIIIQDVMVDGHAYVWNFKFDIVVWIFLLTTLHGLNDIFSVLSSEFCMHLSIIMFRVDSSRGLLTLTLHLLWRDPWWRR